MRGGIFHLGFARGQIPLADRGDDLDGGIERGDGRLEADLVVALTGAAVRNVLRAHLMRVINQVLRDERAGQGGQQRVLALVQGVCRQRLVQVLVSKLLAHVGDDAFLGADLQGAVADLLQTVVLLADLADHAVDVQVLLVHEPLHADGRIQSAGVGQNNLILRHVLFLSLSRSCVSSVRGSLSYATLLCLYMIIEIYTICAYS